MSTVDPAEIERIQRELADDAARRERMAEPGAPLSDEDVADLAKQIKKDRR